MQVQDAIRLIAAVGAARDGINLSENSGCERERGLYLFHFSLLAANVD